MIAISHISIQFSSELTKLTVNKILLVCRYFYSWFLAHSGECLVEAVTASQRIRLKGWQTPVAGPWAISMEVDFCELFPLLFLTVCISHWEQRMIQGHCLFATSPRTQSHYTTAPLTLEYLNCDQESLSACCTPSKLARFLLSSTHNLKRLLDLTSFTAEMYPV